jgi:hypothetical protein
MSESKGLAIIAAACTTHLQGLGASDCKTELSRRHILADVSTDQTV